MEDLITLFHEKCRGDALPNCQAACPAKVNVKDYIASISKGDFGKAIEIVRQSMPFPGVCGRVCRNYCEAECNRREVDDPIAIRALKRFVADYELQEGRKKATPIVVTKTQKVAVIGSGPASLACAYDLMKKGYRVVVFEAFPKPGGLLRYAIPEYRLPKSILDNEIAYLQELGLEIRTDCKITEVRELFDQDYGAVFVGAGALASQTMSLPGEDSPCVIDALEFLHRVNSGEKVKLGEKVSVIGGGNAAIDSARTAVRLGAKKVELLYRRTEKEMPADRGEIEEMLAEGVQMHFLVQPVNIFSENGKSTYLECIKMQLGEPDGTGRARPVPVENSHFSINVDNVIVAVGQQVDISCVPRPLRLTGKDMIAVNPVTLQTSIEGVFAGGDAVTGPSDIIRAISAGKEAAISIERYLEGASLREDRNDQRPKLAKMTVEAEQQKPRTAMPRLSAEDRQGFAEVETGFDERMATEEAQRCLACECKICVKGCEFLSQNCDSPKDLIKKYVNGAFKKRPQIPYSCNLCDYCERICPEDLNVGHLMLKIRKELVESGVTPLKSHQILIKTQQWTVSDEFSLALPNPAAGATRRVFFPGCHLTSYSPSMVLATYEWLRNNIPDVGFLLRCCGAPTRGIGDFSSFDAIRSGLEYKMDELGATELLVACPNCYRTIKKTSPDIHVTSIYELMGKTFSGQGNSEGSSKATLALHDPCAGRWESAMHESARELIKKAGFTIYELEYSKKDTRCCGMGGMIAFANPGLAAKIANNRIGEVPGDLDMVTYCATCRDTLGKYKPTLHLLDLLFNLEWQKTIKQLNPTPEQKTENQKILKVKMVERYIGQQKA